MDIIDYDGLQFAAVATGKGLQTTTTKHRQQQTLRDSVKCVSFRNKRHEEDESKSEHTEQAQKMGHGNE